MSATAGHGASVVYVVVLNWNGWRDTVACLESLLRLRYPAYQIVVCDNASTDESPVRLLAWARGDGSAPAAPAADALAHLYTPPVPKPVAHAVLDRAAAERGGGPECDGARVVFVQTGANLGYAGGCNVGLRYALARGDCAHAWVLNNDTVVDPDALTALVCRVAAVPGAGLCGSRVLYYDAPTRVQSWGGARYNRWLGTVRRLGDGAPAREVADAAEVERRTDYVSGASVLVTRAFLDRVGLMREDYFLYFEELDWALRGAEFRRAYAHGSIVYHREGGSSGQHADPAQRSRVADLHGLRNRVLITRRFFPAALPTIYLSMLFAIANRIRRGQFDRVGFILSILARASGPPEALPAAPLPAPRMPS